MRCDILSSSPFINSKLTSKAQSPQIVQIAQTPPQTTFSLLPSPSTSSSPSPPRRRRPLSPPFRRRHQIHSSPQVWRTLLASSTDTANPSIQGGVRRRV
ncbi:hypothetical protein AKJ16_DCAP23624 [Drosera capensis]